METLLQRGGCPLTIQSACSDEANVLYSKGHHNKDLFMQAARVYWGEPLKGWSEARHMWWRWVPCKGGEYTGRYHPAAPGARGAFPVTVTDWY
jgi:hypothetical protein